MKFGLVGSILGLGCLTSFASADLYGLSSDTPGAVYTIDSGTGAATKLFDLSGQVTNTSIVDIEFLGGKAYACDVYNDDLGQYTFGSIDMSTGAYTVINSQDGSSNWFALAAKESAGIMYTVDYDDNKKLKTVDAAGTVTTIGNTGTDGIRGMAYNSLTDTVYGITADSLFTLDQTTGLATLVGLTGVIDGNSDLAFDAITNTLYMNVIDKLYTVDMTTGASTFIGLNNVSANIDGLAYKAPVPEPATMIALGAGIAALARRRRRA